MRYFLEVAYKGTAYAGFQVQQNAITIQGEIEKVLRVYFRSVIALSGSSRTDAGVHALQNFFHFDIDIEINQEKIYNFNALLPRDIVVKALYPVASSAHCRFHAVSREYKYFISKKKNPFVTDTAWFYPYTMDVEVLNEAAAMLLNYTDFSAFSKRNTGVKTKECRIKQSRWYYQEDLLVYHVEANRFLRGMVRGLAGTMLLAGRNKISLDDFKKIIESGDCTKANFSTPAHGLFLINVKYPFSF